MDRPEIIRSLFRQKSGEIRTPVFPMLAADHGSELAGIGLSRVLREKSAIVDAYSSMMETYKPDGLLFFSDVGLEAEAAGMELTISDDDGASPLKHVHFDEIREVDPSRDGRLPMYLSALLKLVGTYHDQVPVFCSMKDPFSLAAQAVGSEDFFVACVLQPELVDVAMRRAAFNQARLVEAIIDSDATPFIGAPMASGSLISPVMFERFVSPALQALFEQIHENGLCTCLHICGDIKPVLPMLSQLSLDLLSIEAITSELAEQYLKRTVIMGIADTDALLRGTPQKCRMEADRSHSILPEFSVISTGCDIPRFAPPENVLAFLNRARELSQIKSYNPAPQIPDDLHE